MRLGARDSAIVGTSVAAYKLVSSTTATLALGVMVHAQERRVHVATTATSCSRSCVIQARNAKVALVVFHLLFFAHRFRWLDL